MNDFILFLDGLDSISVAFGCAYFLIVEFLSYFFMYLLERVSFYRSQKKLNDLIRSYAENRKFKKEENKNE